jgi:hypothetical protein
MSEFFTIDSSCAINSCYYGFYNTANSQCEENGAHIVPVIIN